MKIITKPKKKPGRKPLLTLKNLLPLVQAGLYDYQIAHLFTLEGHPIRPQSVYVARRRLGIAGQRNKQLARPKGRKRGPKPARGAKSSI